MTKLALFGAWWPILIPPGAILDGACCGALVPVRDSVAIAESILTTLIVVVPQALWCDVLSIQEELRVGNDNCVAWRGRHLQIPPTPLRQQLVRARVRVHGYPDGTVPIFRGLQRLASFPPAAPASTEELAA